MPDTQISQSTKTAAMLDLQRLAAAELHTDPFEYLVVERFVRPEHATAIVQDFPAIERGGSFPLASLKYGPAFAQLSAELFSPEFAAVVGKKFAMDLSQYPTMLTVRGLCDSSDGQIHTDSTSKLITVLLYLNPEWNEEDGRLRLLRSRNLSDSAAEVSPAMGNLIVFKRSEGSWHGHEPFEGRRMSLQFNWVNSAGYMRRERLRHGISSLLKRVRGQSAYEG